MLPPLDGGDATAEPTQRSVAVATVPKHGQIKIMSRKGLWSEVCHADACGWLRITAISRDSGAATTKTSLAALKTGREGAGNAVSSTGVRGLDAEAIKVDQPDHEALRPSSSGRLLPIRQINLPMKACWRIDRLRR